MENIKKLFKLLELTGAIGGALAIQHKTEYGKWWDDKTKCHGKAGAGILTFSLLTILGIKLKGDNE